MRIALVIERFEPHGGGVEAVAWRVARGLVAAGDDVHVCARTADAAAPNGVEVHLVPVSSTWQPWRVWRFSEGAAAANARIDTDCVQSFSRTRHQDIFRAGGGCHASYMERTYHGLGLTLRRASPRHALALAMDRAVFGDERQTILCNSEMVRDEIAERFGVAEDRLRVIVNGVDTVRFHPRGTEKPRRRTNAERTWLLVGSGFHRKGVDTALAALALRPPDEHLTVVGKDPTDPWITRARALGVADRVAFLGPRDDLPALYREADALLLPTRYDAFANVCLEAAASGIPVVTSGANGAARWIGEGGDVVDDPEDVEGFASALDRVRPDAIAASMGLAARRRAESSTWDHHIRALRSLYEEVAS